jgi:hypothetical protein
MNSRYDSAPGISTLPKPKSGTEPGPCWFTAGIFAPQVHNLNQGAPQLPKARLYAAGAPGNARCALGIVSAPPPPGRGTGASAARRVRLLADFRAQSSGRHCGGRPAAMPVPHTRDPRRHARLSRLRTPQISRGDGPKSRVGVPQFSKL